MSVKFDVQSYPLPTKLKADVSAEVIPTAAAANGRGGRVGGGPTMEIYVVAKSVSSSPRVNGSTYPVQSLARNLDWINLIPYDFYGPSWSPSQTNSHAQLFDPVNHVSGSDGINQWIQEGVPPQKVVFGIPFYGYAWQLNNTNIHGLRTPATGKSDAYDDLWMTYAQIRDFIVQHRATAVHDDRIVGDYCYSGRTWISYDDTQSVRTKVSYIKSRNLLGYYANDISGMLL
ncbi:hypothetical protein RND71_005529 [Anisodus tanguticus]|uniref:GH18 domain-containing protein n=1 Tax=Anisodus tanguticus TaxID=243964 RepID=A0AAE1ST77_9SOLA|nr:hypothetical protein RND71_005529 [Anisodus tanguticus]